MTFVDSSEATSSDTVRLHLSGSANGSLAVRASRYPDVEFDDPAHTQLLTSSGAFPTILATLPGDGFWYIWVVDGDGASQAYPLGDLLLQRRWLAEAGEALRDRIDANRAELDAMLQLQHPGGRTFAVSFGFGNSQLNTPFVVVTSPRLSAEPVALGGVYRYEVGFSISMVCTKSSDETDETSVAAGLGATLLQMLNRPRYSALALAGGCTLSFCRARDVTVNVIAEPVEAGTIWFTVATLQWSGELLYEGA